MPLQMQRLLKEMREIESVDFAEPKTDAGPEEMYVTQVPMPIRRMAAVLQLRTEELRKEVFYFVHDVSTSPEDTIDRLRRYVDFITAAIKHETEELVPEIADLKRKGALIVFRKKWTIYAVENVWKPDPGIPMDVVAELVAEQLLDEIDKENENRPPPDEHDQDHRDEESPSELDDIPDDWSGEGNIASQMEDAGWFDTAAGIAQRGRGENIDEDDDNDGSDDDSWD